MKTIRFLLPVLMLSLGCACSQDAVPPKADVVAARIHRLGAFNMQERVRVVIASALPAYTPSGSGLSRILTANANGALAAQDGVSLAANDPVLLTAGAAGADNGIWFVSAVGSVGTPWILQRSTGFQTGLVYSTMQVMVGGEGTLYGGATFQLVTSGAITVDTTAVTFVQLPYRVANNAILPGAGVVMAHRVDAVCLANVAATSGLAVTCDGVALGTVGMRALLAAQTTGAQMGIWTIASGAWTRPPDYFTGDTVPTGTLVEVAAGGTQFSQSTWKMTSAAAQVIDTGTTAWYPRFAQGSLGTCTYNGAGTCTPTANFWLQAGALCIASYGTGVFVAPGSVRVSTQTTGAGSGNCIMTSSSGTDASPGKCQCVNW